MRSCACPRTIRKHIGQGGTIPWIACSTAMVNVYYFYCVDADFGPFFLEFGYWPNAATALKHWTTGCSPAYSNF